GTVSPRYRTNTDITANSSTETSLVEMARPKFIGRSAVVGEGGKPALPRVASATRPVLARGVALGKAGRYRQSATLQSRKCKFSPRECVLETAGRKARARQLSLRGA